MKTKLVIKIQLINEDTLKYTKNTDLHDLSYKHIHSVIHMSSGEKMEPFPCFRNGLGMPRDFYYPRLHLTILFYVRELVEMEHYAEKEYLVLTEK